MQVLYAAQRQEDMDAAACKKMFQQLAQRSFELLLQNLLILQRTAEYAKQDEARRRAKHLPSEIDKAFTAKLATNPILSSLSNNVELRRLYDRYRIGRTIDAEQISKLYRAFLKTDAYTAYLAEEQTSSQEHIDISLVLYKWLQSEEIFQTMVEDHFPLWDENKSLIIGAMKKLIKSLPADEQTFEQLQQPAEAVQDFGERLLDFILEADEQLLARIQPVLQNWDVERVAVIDMVLIKMAVGEFLNFSGIPASVSLNEYVEISKAYSTDKSKEFINGVLDRLLKQLQEEGLVSKES
ncbi:MAG: transcription antitermination factor NusB [Bacteroidota bacterium]